MSSPFVNPLPPEPALSPSEVPQPIRIVQAPKGEAKEGPTKVASLSKSLSETKTAAKSQKLEMRGARLAYPFSVRLSVCHTLRAAKAVVDSYKKKGIEAYWVKVNLERGVRFRVFTGSFPSYGEASRFKKEKQLRPCLVQKTPYSALVGNYTHKEELEDKIQSLEKLDCCPYTIVDRDGKFQLYVGAFITRDGAEEQQRELAFHGIESRMVKR